MNEFDLFAMKIKKANKTNSSVRFLGESMMRQSAFEINRPLIRAEILTIFCSYLGRNDDFMNSF